ncbi:MAG: hypothetical protein VW625_02295 [Perlucidibaca sp.]
MLGVPDKEVTRVMLASSLGTLRLAIRPPEETVSADPNAGAPVAGATAPAAPAGSSVVPSQSQRQLLTSSALQPYAPSRAAAPKAGKPRQAEPAVVIYRGLDAQKVSP